MKNIISLIIYLIVFISYGQKNDNVILSNAVKKKIDSLFSKFDNLNSPGYVIGIAKNDKTLYKKGYGAANLDYSIPINQYSMFSIASVSKQFTAACIALLILENKVSLETPASDFIPELKKYSDTIQIKHLIYNTSGITDYMRLKRKSGKSWVTFNYFEIEECISTSLEQPKLQFKPGEKWDYCNVNFMLLTKIIEKISGQSFSEFAKNRLFKPLKMNDTFINDDITSIVKNRVTPYNLRTKEYVNAYYKEGIKLKSEGKYIQHPRNSPHYGGSGIMTTINDLLKWCSNMTNKSFGGKELYNLMHKTIKFNHEKDNEAFGLSIGKFKGRKTVAWDGGDFGISSQLLRFPEEGISIIVLSNLGSGQAFRKTNQIADIIINQGLME